MESCEFLLQAATAYSNKSSRVIRDARLYARSKDGYAINFIFATDDVLATWPKFIIPNSPELVRMVVNMETPTIGVNFAITDRSDTNT